MNHLEALKLANKIVEHLYPDIYGKARNSSDVALLVGCRGLIVEVLEKEQIEWTPSP